MKTLCNRIKSTLQADPTILTYVQPTSIQVVSIDMLPDISQTILPFIGVAASQTQESWFSTGKLNIIHQVRIYVVQELEVYEAAMIGDSVKPSIFELLDYVKNALRTKYFAVDGTNYLSKPSRITNTRYSTAPYGDNVFCFVGSIDIECFRMQDTTAS